MKTNTLLGKLRAVGKSYFSINDIRKFYDGSNRVLAVSLSRLVKQGKIEKLLRGYYCFDSTQVDFEQFACEIKQPSYISLEYALYHHGLIDQVPEVITLITSGKSARLGRGKMILEYSHIKENLYFGYEVCGNMLMAGKEKALLDEIYLVALGKRSFNLKKEWLNMVDEKLFWDWIGKYPTFVEGYVMRAGRLL